MLKFQDFISIINVYLNLNYPLILDHLISNHFQITKSKLKGYKLRCSKFVNLLEISFFNLFSSFFKN